MEWSEEEHSVVRIKVDDGWSRGLLTLLGTKYVVLTVERGYGEPLWMSLPCVFGMHTCKTIKVTGIEHSGVLTF